MRRLRNFFGLCNSPQGFGLRCNNAGLTLAGAPLLKQSEGGFLPRPSAEIHWLMTAAYQRPSATATLETGLQVVARALNTGEMGRAMIGAVLLKLPDLDWAGAVRIAQADEALEKYNPDEPRDSYGRWTSDEPLMLPPGKRIDELGDLLEWVANARPEDAPIIRGEIKRYYYDAGDIRGGNALNEALSNIVYGEPTRAERQDVLDTFEMYTRADPAEIGQAGRDLLVMGLSPALEVASELSETAELDIWKKGWSARGLHIEKALGGNLPPGFPVIDRFAEGAVTSIKTVDLRAASYQSTARLTSRLNRYVNSVAKFSGDGLGEITIDEDEITGRVLHLAVPRASITATQSNVLRAISERASRLGVVVKLTEF